MARTEEAAPSRDKICIVVAHPGHELMVHHFIERHRPLYFCLTDGSGGNAKSRLASTSRLLHEAGGIPGRIYGRFTDREIYQFLLDGRVEVFAGLAAEMAENLIDSGIECVAGDAMEGFNPGHDICRALIDGAVAIVQARTGRLLHNYEFAVYDDPAATAPGALIRLELDDDALERKVAAAMAYPEIQDEVRAALNKFGKQSFAVEYLRPATTSARLDEFELTPPRYELLGEIRVSEDRYRQVIRYREHLVPIFHALGIAAHKDQWTT
jgi:hypothetical protein